MNFRVNIDTDAAAGYQSKAVIRRCVRWWLWPLLRRLPERPVRWLVTDTSEHMRAIVRFRRTHRALKLIYNWGRPNEVLPELLRSTQERTWFGRTMAWSCEELIVSATATRNRFRQVQKLTMGALDAVPADEPFSILSLGSGSGQAILEVLALEAGRCERPILLHALDRSANARRDCWDLAVALGVPEDWLRIEACNLRKLDDLTGRLGEGVYDEIEVVGFSEYQSHAYLVELGRLLWGHLKPNGVLLLNNARRTPESWFSDIILDWRLDFKEPEEMGEILLEAGFRVAEVEVIGEPTGVFWMAKGVRRHGDGVCDPSEHDFVREEACRRDSNHHGYPLTCKSHESEPVSGGTAMSGGGGGS